VSARRATLAMLVAGALALPASAAAQNAAGKPIVGGGSFNTAPLLAPGSYTDTVAAGETVYWKVRVAKGQVLRVKATVDTSQIQTDPAADDYDRGLAYLQYFLDIFSPLREQFSKENVQAYDSASARLEGSAGAEAKSGTATGPRALGFEQILASDYDKDTFPGPGEWYVSLNAADSGPLPAEVPVALPVDLDVEVLGQAQPSSADFARSLPGPSKQQPASPVPDRPSGVTDLLATADQPADPALTIALVGAIALVGGLVLGALAIVVLGLGRRRAAGRS
jgi:Ca-activated chloride channel family protein